MRARSVSPILAVMIALAGLDQVRLFRVTGGDSDLITAADLTCQEAYITPYVNSGGGRTAAWPVAFRHSGDDHEGFIYDGGGHIRGFIEPEGDPCDTALVSMVQAENPGWGGDWGEFVVNAEGDYIPGQNATSALALWHDDDTGRLTLSWASSYSLATPSNTFGSYTLDSGDHSMDLVGCWAILAYSARWTGSGALRIPSGFVSEHLPAGRSWGIGFGGFVGSNGNSMGPTLIAVDPPESNACAAETTYNLASSTVLASFEENNTGPNCSAGPPGCTPGTAPTTPYAARMAFSAYSLFMYPFTWDPYDGHGWWTFDMRPVMGWYDDGVKHGVVVPFTVPSGWMNSTVSAATTPTFNSGDLTGQFTATSIDTNDGAEMNPGDAFWVQTCEIGVNAGCAAENGNTLTIARVDAVNRATNLIDYTSLGTDPSDSSHAAVVGGNLYFGCVYAHGSPGCSRNTFRLQIYDPVQYGEVIATTRQPYNVQYVEETDATSFFPQYGSPAAGGGSAGSMVNGGRSVIGVIPDPDHQMIRVVLSNAKNQIGTVANIVYKFAVNQSAPEPRPLLSGLWWLGLLAVAAIVTSLRERISS